MITAFISHIFVSKGQSPISYKIAMLVPPVFSQPPTGKVQISVISPKSIYDMFQIWVRKQYFIDSTYLIFMVLSTSCNSAIASLRLPSTPHCAKKIDYFRKQTNLFFKTKNTKTALITRMTNICIGLDHVQGNCS